MLNKETLFNDLPQNIKQKIISVRNLGTFQPIGAAPVPLKEFGSICIPSARGLHSTFLQICEMAKNLKPSNVEESLRSEIAEFKRFVDAYKLSINDRDFVGEFDKTIQMMECRFRNIKNGKK